MSSSPFALRKISWNDFYSAKPFPKILHPTSWKIQKPSTCATYCLCNYKLFSHLFINLVFVYLCACLCCHFLLQLKHFDLTTVCLYIFFFPSRTWMSKFRKFSQGIKSSKGLYECVCMCERVCVCVCVCLVKIFIRPALVTQ